MSCFLNELKELQYFIQHTISYFTFSFSEELQIIKVYCAKNKIKKLPQQVSLDKITKDEL